MRHLRWALGIVIGGIALYVAFAGVEWRTVGTALEEANYGLLLAALPLLVTVFVMRAQRWRLLFSPDTNIGILSTFGALNIGYLAGIILPLQLGEVVRVYVLGEMVGVGKLRVLSTVAVERLLDVFVLLAFLGLLIPFVALPQAALVTAALLLGLVLAIALVITVAVLDRARFERWLEWLLRYLPARVQGMARSSSGSLLDGLSALSHPKILLSVLFWSVSSWATSAVVIYMILRAFSLDVPVAAAPFLLVATTFGFFVPSLPAAVGVYDAIAIRSLTTVFSVAQEPAASYALVAHALYLVPPMILGALFFWRYNLSLRRMRSWSEEQPGVSADPGELVVAPDAARASGSPAIGGPRGPN